MGLDKKPGPSPWVPEPDPLTHQMVGKLGEECAELAKECFRTLIQGFNEKDPVTGELNRTKLVKEMGDVESKLTAIRAYLLTKEERTMATLRRHEKWEYHQPWWAFLYGLVRRPPNDARRPLRFVREQTRMNFDARYDR